MSNKVIRLPAVKDQTGLSRSSIYLRMSKGEFPQVSDHSGVILPHLSQI